MAPTSIIKVIRVLPEAVTVFKNTVAMQDISKATVTTLKMGMPASTNSGPCPNSDKKVEGNKFSSSTTAKTVEKLSQMIFFIRVQTSS